MKSTQAKKVVTKKKKQVADKELLIEVPDEDTEKLLLEDCGDPIPNEPELPTLSSSGPEIFVAPTKPRTPKKVKENVVVPEPDETVEEACKYSPAQIKKLRGEYSRRTLQTRFGITF